MTDGNTVNPRYSATVIHRNLWRYIEGEGKLNIVLEELLFTDCDRH